MRPNDPGKRERYEKDLFILNPDLESGNVITTMGKAILQSPFSVTKVHSFKDAIKISDNAGLFLGITRRIENLEKGEEGGKVDTKEEGEGEEDGEGGKSVKGRVYFISSSSF